MFLAGQIFLGSMLGEFRTIFFYLFSLGVVEYIVLTCNSVVLTANVWFSINGF